MGFFSSNKKDSSSKDSSSKDSSSKDASGSSAGASRRPSPPRQAAEEQYRPVYLLVFPSATFKAHWAIFVPEAASRSVKKGKMIHIVGNVREGFELEVRRNYNMDFTRSRPLPPIEIGLVSTRHLVDTPGDGSYIVDLQIRDTFEEIIASVPAPGRSLNNASGSQAPTGPPRRVVLSDCQWWTLRCVKELVESGYMIAPSRGPNKGRSPVDIVTNAPKH